NGQAAQSLTDVPQWGELLYQDVYPGIDVIFHSDAHNAFEYDVQARPGADLSQVKLTWQGAGGLTTDDQGNLHIATPSGDLIENAPRFYQQDGSTRQAVTGSQVLLGNNQVGFTAANVDPTKTLIVDPVLGFSSYAGGSGNDYGNAISVAPDGTATLVGTTSSTNFPVTTGAIQGASN